ncbi:MAG: CoA-binding protein, partial [Deltaproteobacteria bacterium]|nr:CoA-binding protein [Deltaproteobacteria bacterium]
VHPTEGEVRGHRAYKSVLDLPEVPDLAIIVLPRDVVCPAMEECGRKGVRRAIVVSGGFREVGSEGAAMQKQLEHIADEYGIRFLGPNCLGVANPHLKLNPTPLPAEGPPGFVGLASQSGSFVTQMFNYLHRHGLGFSTALSVGNEANIDIVECMEYLGACPNTKVIALYVEGITRGREFMEAARAITPRKPIVALYVGGSETGRRAGLSHTGAMAGPDGIYDGMFRQSGIIRAQTLAELFDFCLALGILPRPRGNRVIVQTHSGGPGAVAADSLGRAGFVLPALSASIIRKLRTVIPKEASTNNPVDRAFAKDIMDDFYKIPDILLQEENADMLMVYFVTPDIFLERGMKSLGMPPDEIREEVRKLIDQNMEAFFSLTKKHDKPVIGYTYRSLREQMVQGLLERGVPIYQGPERAARAMAALLEYHRMRERLTSGDCSYSVAG